MFYSMFLPEAPNPPTNESLEEFIEEVHDLESLWDATSYLLISIGLAVMLENVFVFFGFVFHRQLRVLSNTFVVSLSVADFMYALYSTVGTFLVHNAKVWLIQRFIIHLD